MPVVLPLHPYLVNTHERKLEQEMFPHLSRRKQLVFSKIACYKVKLITGPFPLLDVLFPIIHCGGEANCNGSCPMICISHCIFISLIFHFSLL